MNWWRLLFSNQDIWYSFRPYWLRWAELAQLTLWFILTSVCQMSFQLSEWSLFSFLQEIVDPDLTLTWGICWYLTLVLLISDKISWCFLVLGSVSINISVVSSVHLSSEVSPDVFAESVYRGCLMFFNLLFQYLSSSSEAFCLSWISIPPVSFWWGSC